MAAQGLSMFPAAPSSSAPNQSRRKRFEEHFLTFNPSNSFVGTKLLDKPNSTAIASTRRISTIANVSSSLPITKIDEVASDKTPKWSSRAIKSFAMGELEARKLKYPNTGTEALLMGIIVEGTSSASKFLRENGITLFKVREETVKLLGKADMYFFSPEHPPLTESAQRAIDWAFQEKLKSGKRGEITTTHLLLGIWSQKEAAGYKIMASLGLADGKIQEMAKKVESCP